jgi:hypothetical protein
MTLSMDYGSEDRGSIPGRGKYFSFHYQFQPVLRPVNLLPK